MRTVVSFREMNDEERTWLLDGEPRLEGQKWDERWPGVRGFFDWLERKRYKTHVRILLAKYRRFVPCPRVHGSKLKAEALNVVVDGQSIAEVGRNACARSAGWIAGLRKHSAIADARRRLLRELGNRVGYLNEVGLGYLTLERQGADPLGRRGPADSSRERARQPPFGNALCARRTDRRAACGRLAQAARRPAPSARPRQYGGRGRA